MEAINTNITDFLKTPAIWTVPLYQRTYNWTRDQCNQLWEDIERLNNDKNNNHFIGSIVYVKSRTRLQTILKPSIVIDGQQRLTTISLFIYALSKIMDEKKYSGETNSDAIKNYFLFNNNERGNKKYRLVLTKNDKNTYINILENRDPPSDFSTSVVNNFKFFMDKIRNTKINLDDLISSLERLLIVEITLEQGKDNPQLIFESLNSTGLKLTQADLIRNYILMGLDSEKQEMIYNNYWYPMEKSFRVMDKNDFDRFMRYFLHVQTRKERILIGNVYNEFKIYWKSKNNDLDSMIKEIHKFSKYYVSLKSANFKNDAISKTIKNINELQANVVYPFLLEVIDDQQNGIIKEYDLIKIFKLVESYVFRRAICGVPTNSMNYTFAVLAKDIKKEDYLNSLKYIFNKKEKQYRFPIDDEFRKEFIISDVYNFDRCKYLLTKLENYNTKEPVDTKGYTIEHIMPQNSNMSKQWKDDLGVNWEIIHKKYLHTVGNLTLTGYNAELSDRSFHEKKNMKFGFTNSTLKLNKNIANLEEWNEQEIEKRASELADHALEIWTYPKLDINILSKYDEELEKELNEDHPSEKKSESWTLKLEKTNSEKQKIINEIIPHIITEFNCHGRPAGSWYYFYTDESEEEKFAVLLVGVNTLNLSFRIDPETFFINDPQIRTVKGFFWRHVERRIHITSDNLDLVMDCIMHAYNAAKKLQSTEL